VLAQTAAPAFFAAMLLLQVPAVSTSTALNAMRLLLSVRASPSRDAQFFAGGLCRARAAAAPHFRMLALAVAARVSILAVVAYAAAAALKAQRPASAVVAHLRAAAYDAPALFLAVPAKAAAAAIFAAAPHASVQTNAAA